MSNAQLILKDATCENKIFSNRAIIAWILVFFLLVLIFSRLYFLQVIEQERYIALSKDNRIKVLPLPPSRGLIYDRNGVLLADNRVSYSLEVIPEKVTNLDLMLKELNNIITIEETDIVRFKKQLRQLRRFRTIPLRYRLTDDEVALLSLPSPIPGYGNKK